MAGYSLDEVREAIRGHLEATAWWRSGKSAEYPHDKRNAAATNEAEELAASVDAIPEILLRRFARAWPDDGDYRASELMSEMTRRIGFHSAWGTAAEFVDDLLSELNRESEREDTLV